MSGRVHRQTTPPGQAFADGNCSDDRPRRTVDNRHVAVLGRPGPAMLDEDGVSTGVHCHCGGSFADRNTCDNCARHRVDHRYGAITTIRDVNGAGTRIHRHTGRLLAYGDGSGDAVRNWRGQILTTDRRHAGASIASGQQHCCRECEAGDSHGQAGRISRPTVRLAPPRSLEKKLKICPTIP